MVHAKGGGIQSAESERLWWWGGEREGRTPAIIANVERSQVFGSTDVFYFHTVRVPKSNQGLYRVSTEKYREDLAKTETEQHREVSEKDKGGRN